VGYSPLGGITEEGDFVGSERELAWDEALIMVGPLQPVQWQLCQLTTHHTLSHMMNPAAAHMLSPSMEEKMESAFVLNVIAGNNLKRNHPAS
jgi:hypothetical protein